MLNVAYIFPGQGAQYVGMGEDFYRRFPEAKEVFECADKVLGFDLTELIFKGQLEELTRTVNCQMAVFTVSVACLRALETGTLATDVRFTAGLSLGEYTALVAAGALEFTEALRLVRNRAQYMEQASGENPGGMVSIIGLPLDTVEKICQQAKVEVSNLNCPGQVVVSGNPEALEKAREIAGRLGARKTIPLKVSGAFHSSLMKEAAQRFSSFLERFPFSQPICPLVSNAIGGYATSAGQIKDNLKLQMDHPVLWEKSMRLLLDDGFNVFVEVGLGGVLQGLMRRIDRSVTCLGIDDEDLRKGGQILNLSPFS